MGFVGRLGVDVMGKYVQTKYIVCKNNIMGSNTIYLHSVLNNAALGYSKEEIHSEKFPVN